MKLNKIILSSIIASTFSFAIDYQFNYFGNLSLTQVNKDGYMIRSVQGYDLEHDHLDFRQYSKLGGQLLFFGDNYLFRTQAVVKRGEEKYDTELTWLNAQYNFTDNLSIRAGRMQMPMFLNSDTLDIDYIHTWAKPPVEMYGLVPITYYDGAEIHYQTNINDTYLKFEVPLYGKTDTKLNTNSIIGTNAKLDVTKFKGIKAIAEYENLTFKTSYYNMKTELPFDISGNLDVESNLNPLLLAILHANNLTIYDLAQNNSLQTALNKLSWNKTKTTILSLGLAYDDGDYIFSTEYSKSRFQESVMPNMEGLYAIAGFRYNKFTPYISFAQHKNKESHFKINTIQASELINTYDPTQTTYNQVQSAFDYAQDVLENYIYLVNYSQNTTSLGIRYDYDIGIALKFQLDKTTTKSYGVVHKELMTNYERLGFTGRKLGVEDKPIYQATMSISFAF
jgi:hypothetical protein